MTDLLLAVVLGYFVGSIPTSYLAGRIRRVDLTQHGSKNFGATNVLRVLGWRYALPVFIVDVAKGAVPTGYFASWIGGPAWSPALYGVAAVVGHAFSVFMRFRGGKGVATGAGVFLALAPLALAIGFGVWLATFGLTRYVSLGSMLAAASFPIVILILDGTTHVFWVGLALALFVIFSHRANIRRLVSGEELRFGGGQGVSA